MAASEEKVTLKDIWDSSREEITATLVGAEQVPTTSLAYDRARVAMLYYNAELLTEAEKIWVAHPNFVATAQIEASLPELLHRLQTPYVTALLHLSMFGELLEQFIVIDSEVVSEIADRKLANSDEDDPNFDEAWSDPVIEDTQVLAGIVLFSRDVFSEGDQSSLLGLSMDVYAQVASRWHTLFSQYLHPNLSPDSIIKKKVASLPADASLHDILKFWVEEIWSAILDRDITLRTMVRDVVALHSTLFSERTLNVKEIIAEFLEETNFVKMHPHIRCFTLYSIWEIMTIAGANVIYPELEALFWERATKFDCIALFSSTADKADLTATLLPVLGDILQEYLEPPSREVMIARIKSMLSS